MIVLVILLVGAAVFLPKYLPLVVRTKQEPSPRAKELLSYAPVAVLAALVAPAVLTPVDDGPLALVP
ncbi:hypothetical protein C5C13_11735 [Clavibacter michiganensis]|nr:hypothetical protein C5C13_11735 [Clavibacter michiganensis]